MYSFEPVLDSFRWLWEIVPVHSQGQLYQSDPQGWYVNYHPIQHEWQIPQTHQRTSDNHDKYMVRATSTRQNRAGS
jgi:hypothetical protein